MRLSLVFGALFWIGIITIAYTGSDPSKDIAILISFLFLLPTVMGALSFNLSWLAYDGQGIEWHRPMRRPVCIGWMGITAVRRFPAALDIEGPDRRIVISGRLDGMEELGREIEKRVPNGKFSIG